MFTPPDKTIAFTFVSHPTKSIQLRWTAVLTFPAGATRETILPIRITDGEGLPVEGMFEFAAQKLKVTAGSTSISYADFIAGKHSVPLWLHRKGLPAIPGGLTFG